MSLAGTRARLQMLTKELLRGWDETRNSWSDMKAQEFERTYLVELEARVDKAAAVLDKLDELLRKVKDDCD